MANNSFSPKIGQDRLEPIIGVSHVSKQGKGSFFDRATREWCNHDFRQLRRKISILDESSEGEWTESDENNSDSENESEASIPNAKPESKENLN